MDNLIIQAFQEATELHKNQVRKYSKKSYITHIIRVAGRTAIQPNVTISEVIAAIFHDVPEDCAQNQEEQDSLIKDIENKYGVESARIVRGLTNPTKFSIRPRAERKEIDRNHIAAQCLKVKRIKAIDRIDNLTETLSDLCYSEVNGGIYQDLENWALLYCDESDLLAEVLEGIDGKLLEELKNTIKELRRVAEQMVRWRSR